MIRKFLAGVFLILVAGFVYATDPPTKECCGASQEVKPPVKGKSPVKHGRGHVTAKNLKELVEKSWKKHGGKLMALPKVTAAAYDCRTLGIVGKVRDQGQCGKCWDDSACGVIDSAFFVAGWPNDGSFATSAQYVIDCGSNGGCNGDDASTVTNMALATGLPLMAQYGPDNDPNSAGPNPCKDTSKMTFYKLTASGYCDNTTGQASVQSIKNAIVKYGPVSCAVDASAFNNYAGGVMQAGPNNPANIDHDVSIIGWDDNKVCSDGTKGAWLVKNQWSDQWGEGGYCWIPYSSWCIGTAALWCTAPAPPTPPTPPGPTPPGPTPPTPTNGGTIRITVTDATGTVTRDDTYPLGTPSTAITGTMTLFEFADYIISTKGKKPAPKVEPMKLPPPLKIEPKKTTTIEEQKERIDRLALALVKEIEMHGEMVAEIRKLKQEIAALKKTPTPAYSATDLKTTPKEKQRVRFDMPPDAATILIAVPDNAEVYVDGKRLNSTSILRVVQSPILKDNAVYVYDVTMVMGSGQQKVTKTQSVSVRRGQITGVDFNSSLQVVGAK